MKEYILDVRDGSDITKALQSVINEFSEINIKILIPAGTYATSNTILICSNTVIKGASNFSTKLILSDKTNDNIFTNHDHQLGAQNIGIESLWLDGNAFNQYKSANENRLSYCNACYFKNCKNINFYMIRVHNCKQTALHFNNCDNVKIEKLKATRLGWSGISTSGTNNIVASEVYIYDSGKDKRHSAVHFDGGSRSYFDGEIEKCTGNAVMLDSKYSSFNKSIINAKCAFCKRGIAILGFRQNLIKNVLVHCAEISNTEVGILVSNARHVFVADCKVNYSKKVALSFQGKYGVADSVVSNSFFKKNRNDIKQCKNSDRNYFFGNVTSSLSEKVIFRIKFLFLSVQNFTKKRRK